MESTDKKISRSEKVQIIFTALLVIAILLFTVTIVLFLKNMDLIKTNPIDYTIDNSDMDGCTCFDMNGNYQDFWGTGDKNKLVIENWTG